ncbi:MAG: hypothetical protein JXA67_01035 [Micromonosporaceae bacterium]|nr:hypothetical protein [Micromonosporaceae bacterium]
MNRMMVLPYMAEMARWAVPSSIMRVMFRCRMSWTWPSSWSIRIQLTAAVPSETTPIRPTTIMILTTKRRL